MTAKIGSTEFDTTSGTWPHNLGASRPRTEGAPLCGLTTCPLGCEHIVRDRGGVDGIGPLPHLPHHRVLPPNRVTVDGFTLGKAAFATDNHSGGLVGPIAGDADLVLLRSLDRSGFSGMSRVDFRGVPEESIPVDDGELFVVFHVLIIKQQAVFCQELFSTILSTPKSEVRSKCQMANGKRSDTLKSEYP